MDDKKIGKVINQLIQKKNITRKQACEILKSVLDHKFANANDVCFGAFFAAMQTKGPIEDEVAGLMDAVLKYDGKLLKIKDKNFCGIIGSGKDDLKTINISTGAALVASGAGANIVKNGSRSETSIAGTTDVLEALGLNVHSSSRKMKYCLRKYGIGFFDAESYFPKMFKEYVGKFYFINPISYALSIASAIKFKRMIFGLADKNTEFTAKILKKLDFKHALVARGSDKTGKNSIDEISIIGKTKISELKNKKIKTYFIKPKDFNFKTAKYKEIAQHNTVEKNALHLLKILMGKIKDGGRDMIILNAGAALYVSDVISTIYEGISLAKKSIDSGKALEKLKKLIIMSDGNIKTLNHYIKKVNENV